MIDAEKFAALICDWCLEVQPGQSVLIQTTTAAEPLNAALYGGVLERGAWPQLDIEVPGQARMLYERGTDFHLDSVSPIQRAVFEAMDARVRIDAPARRSPLAGINAAAQARRAAPERELTAIRMAKRWAGTIWPTPALAEAAGMDFADYEAFLERALFLHRDDPLAAWAELRERQQLLVDRLAPARTIRIQSARTDLTLEVGGRIWRNSDGRRNMPSGEVFTSPHESSANGRIYFDVPSSKGGEVVSGIALTLVDGVITEARAERGDEILQAQLAIDPGARRIGEIGIGTNAGIDRATGSTLLDEKIGGTVHLAIGASYPECGGLNESAIHWDVICDLRSGGEISVDGELLSRDGVFV